MECRNKQLTHLLGKLKLMENQGSGFRLIRQYYEDYPFLINRAARFAENERYRTVLDVMATYLEMPCKSVQSALGLSRSATVKRS